jgi:hypothetical protein
MKIYRAVLEIRDSGSPLVDQKLIKELLEEIVLRDFRVTLIELTEEPANAIPAAPVA